MCDEFTSEAEELALAGKGLSRRQFAAVGAAAALAGCAGRKGGIRNLSEDMVRITTSDGVADAFFVRPSRGKHPGVIFWPDIGGLREVKKVMARRLAGEGYAVLVVNQYYRSAPAPIFNSLPEWRTPEGQEKLKPMLPLVTADAVTRDAKAWVAFLDGRREVDKARGIGTQGYCMGGPFTVRTAAASPRIGAAASFHGGGLVTEAADSPHKLLAGTRARYLIAVARNDDARSPAEKDAFKAAASAAGRPAEVEVYPADHGWCVPDSPVYDPVQADRAWERLLALYAQL